MVQAQGAAPTLQAPYCEERSPEPQMCELLSSPCLLAAKTTQNTA